MLRLAEEKELTRDSAIRRARLPARVYIPTIQHFGKPCDKILVKAGDIVKTGQMLATSDSGLFSPIHSSISGKVVSIASYPHPLLGKTNAITIESDGKGERIPFSSRSRESVESLSKDKIREIIFGAGIVGLGGAGFPSHIKLNPSKPVDTFILNGAECEPYLNVDYRIIIESTGEIVMALEIIERMLGTKQIIIAIEDNKKEAIDKFNSFLLPKHWKIKVLKTRYPQGGEKQLITSVLNREVPSGGLPFDIGVVVHNVGTVLAIYEAVYENKPLYERAVTITGKCLENPGNFLVRIGTTVRDLLADCGPLKEEPAKVIFGGPMMGVAQYSLDAPIIKTTSGIIFFTKDELALKENRVCCRCARCIDVCPARIIPATIGMAAEKERWDIAKDYDVFDCIECGLCSYVCPAKRDLVQLIKYAKARLKPK